MYESYMGALRSGMQWDVFALVDDGRGGDGSGGRMEEEAQ